MTFIVTSPLREWDDEFADDRRAGRCRMFIAYFHELPVSQDVFMSFAAQLLTVQLTGTVAVSVTVTAHNP